MPSDRRRPLPRTCNACGCTSRSVPSDRQRRSRGPIANRRTDGRKIGILAQLQSKRGAPTKQGSSSAVKTNASDRCTNSVRRSISSTISAIQNPLSTTAVECFEKTVGHATKRGCHDLHRTPRNRRYQSAPAQTLTWQSFSVGTASSRTTIREESQPEQETTSRGSGIATQAA
jgi:hypothetical protein